MSDQAGPPSTPVFPPVREQLDLLLAGTDRCVSPDELERKLDRSRQAGTPLTVKVGYDPSAPDLHLGHAVVLRKMRQFQELGHRVVFLIGDFTGMIGDPTGKKTTRPQLTKDEVARNAETYKAQVFKVLREDRTVVEFNARWLSALGSEGMIRLCAKYTVARLLERDDFSKRFKAGQPISVHELLYPLCQGYDSVALKCDVEMGGTDQLFNLLVGRDLMREEGLEPQVVITLPLLVGLDGVEKMSKSLGNYIGLTDPPDEIYGKVMSVSDELMWTYFQLVTARPASDVERMRREAHPKAAKMELAREVVGQFHGLEAARNAEAEFERRFGKAAGTLAVSEVSLGADAAAQPVKLLVATGLAASANEARRKLKEGAFSVSKDGGATWRRVDSPTEGLGAEAGQEVLLRLGKRFVKVKLS